MTQDFSEINKVLRSFYKRFKEDGLTLAEAMGVDDSDIFVFKQREWKLNPQHKDIMLDMMEFIVLFGQHWLEKYADNHINQYVKEKEFCNQFGQGNRAMKTLKEKFSTDIKIMFNN